MELDCKTQVSDSETQQFPTCVVVYPLPPAISRAKTMASKVVALPIVGMVLSECAQVGLMIVSKAAMSDGMSNLLFIFYSNALASLLLLPISFLFHRYLPYIYLPCFYDLSFTNHNYPQRFLLLFPIFSAEHSVLRSLSLSFAGFSCLVYLGKF